MVITVFGLGFVGLTTALGLAEKGNRVFGYDINKERNQSINNGVVPFLEPGLSDSLKRNLNLNFFIIEEISQAVKDSDLVFFCVGTPYGENGEADLTYVYKAIDQTLQNKDNTKFLTLVIKSTVPPHTATTKIIPYIESKGFRVGLDIGLANNPEFLREGYCWDDFMKPDRVVLGVNDPQSQKTLSTLYEPFHAPVFIVNNSTSEFIKYLSNTLLATMISYSNEMSKIALLLEDVSVKQAFEVLHLDKRWGNGTMKAYVYPGAGYGGYCLPKDTSAFFALSNKLGYDANILKNVIHTNDTMPDFICQQIIQNLPNPNAKIGILGLSFKPNSDDVRDSPSAKIINKLIQNGYQNIIGYDPVANDEFSKLYGFKNIKVKLDDVLQEADLLVVLTAWKDFKNIKQGTPKKVLDFRYYL
jgi:UDPglucose 6-dehydrogenase